jgi:hypothetical protein
MQHHFLRGCKISKEFKGSWLRIQSIHMFIVSPLPGAQESFACIKEATFFRRHQIGEPRVVGIVPSRHLSLGD